MPNELRFEIVADESMPPDEIELRTSCGGVRFRIKKDGTGQYYEHSIITAPLPPITVRWIEPE